MLTADELNELCRLLDAVLERGYLKQDDEYHVQIRPLILKMGCVNMSGAILS